MTKRELLKDLSANVYCRIKPSALSGVGVFAIRQIPKGTNPFRGSRGAKLISFSEKDITSVPAPIKKMIDDFCVFKNGGYLIPDFGLNSIGIAYFLNCSKEPNVIALAAGKNGDVEFIAKRKIKKGEELTVSCNTYSDE